ncbi:spermatid-specific manchette-related protein 1 [Empidonax traillii]|uniref:spermatid-specific manchette-related protein 1 n=1 Tax=Empidonax traillii TaxID=164674 RepID=UPI000FFD53B3|nr:spermatid-specific manchette-related protein 1 [Empidonax traillii]
MFLFAPKHKTSVSSYADSYCLLCSVKKTIKEQAPLQLWKENKFVTQSLLTMTLVQNLVNQSQPEQLIRVEMQEYYRNVINPVVWPGLKNTVFVNEDKYITWRMASYNSTAWNKHPSDLSLLPKEMRMETFLCSIPREVATDMLRKLFSPLSL